ncbi:Ig-like domain-containing protein [Cellulosimicrobium sp. PMB13]|uniref:Ig-like domain-containing protein n=1 Tax=Cellulosimicrobium sp. PMB13 TaxID=3120158 RepID=UPI003F4BD60D
MTTVSVFSTALVGLAWFYEGEATADVELNDSGVWVTKTSAGLLGRFNYESQAMDGSLVAGSASFDVQQDAEQVLLDDDGASAAAPIDVAHLTLDGQIRLPAGADVASGGGTTAILDGEEGLLWVLPFGGATSFDPGETEPVADLDGDGALAVSRDGTVYVADPASGELVTVRTVGGVPEGEPTTSSLPVAASAEVAVTTVGDEPVVLDRSGGQLVLPGGKTVTLDGADGAVLQQASKASENVVVATATGLVTQPLGGGDAQVRRAEGVANAPAQLDGCTYAAWSTTAQVVRDCAGTDRDLDMRLEGVDPQARLEYRVNRHVIVLNDLAAGTLWMAADEYEKVDDWDVVIPEEAEGEESDAELTNPEQVDQFIADRSQPNKPPQPKDDVLGARPGRSTILPVLANDVDPDGDVMTATVTGEGPEGVEVQQVLGGAALQVVVPPDAAGTFDFRYAVSDGRGGVAEAAVSLKVSPMTENEPPQQTGDPVLKVGQGGAATIKVLPFFKDPDGDDLYLASAEATVAGDDVRFRPDGSVEFRDGGGSTGRKVVTLAVADGQGGIAEGKLLVDVIAGDGPPVAVSDHVVVLAGQPVTVEPLRNDTDPNSDALRLATVSESAPAEITANYDAGTFTFLSNEPRSYDLTYEVTDGPNVTAGLVRVDVVMPPEGGGAPVVVADTALLPTGGKTLVDVLANDTDPAGGVLVVQSVTVPDDAGVSVAVLAHQMLRITELRALDGPVTVEYTVSNGAQTSTGQVRVVPVPAPSELRPPRAAADEVTVHAGDVVTIPVLKNDTHPDGLELFLQPELEQDVDPTLGEAFVSEDTLRFKAGSAAGTAYAIYRVRDANGQEDSAQVTIRIRDGEDNAAPVPRDVEARVLAGSSVRVAVPLDGVDPDGDSVQLTGVASPAGKGTASVVDGSLEYRASKSSTGLDTFTYSVLDARGATATGTVRVGISRPAETNQPPVAVDDEITVRPGRPVAVAALVNDTDPDGDQVGLVPSELEDSEGMEPEVVGDRVVITSPADEGAYTFYYGIQDTYGARATGAITVNVAADAPLLPPVARDDAVPVESILGRTSVPVPVLDNDDDPDGVATELEVSTDATGVTVTEDGGLEVVLTERRQIVTYTVTDTDGLSARAFVKVPGMLDQVPTLRPGITPLEVTSGESLEIDITDYVLVVEGRTPRLTTEDTVTALEGSRAVPSATQITYTPNEGYVGPAAVTFEVTDGSGPDDPEGNTALLTLPITVLPPENLAPEMIGTPTLDVAAGEEASVDLARFATDADGDPLTFQVTGQAPGITLTLEGATLHAQAAPDTPKGTVVEVPLTVTDTNHPPVDGSAALTVVASTKPLVRANDDTVDDAHQGKPTTVDVLANDSNPFPDTPLTILDAIVETGASQSVSFAGSDVTVTPQPDFVGVMVVRYRVQDATKDPDREVEGRIQITVLGKPEAPPTPQVEEVRSKTVVLSWDPPNNNGAEITGYTVRSQNGYEKQCGTTTCTLDGLTNDVEYTFTVFATNAVDDGPASPPSAVARPDEKPDPPAAPTLEFGDESLTVTWENATYTDRSAIKCVNLRITAGGGTDKTCVAGTTYEWTGLKNGTSYQVQVQAVNDAPEPSEWGDLSTAMIPAGVPDTPAAPHAARTESAVNGGVVAVTWSAPFENGDAVKTYHLQRHRNGSPDGSPIAVSGKTSYTDTGRDNESSYSYTVVAENKAGKSGASGRSNDVIPYGKPGTPGRPSASLISGDTSGKARVSFGAADANGNAVTYDVRANSSTTRKTTDTTYTFTGLSNGTTYAFDVRACNAAGCSAWTAPSGSVKPYTIPDAPTVRWVRNGNDGHFTIAKNGNGGDAIDQVQWQLSGDANNSGNGTSNVGVPSACGKTYTLQARAHNSAGWSSWSGDTGKTDACPPPPNPDLRVVHGSSAGSGMNYFRVKYTDLPRGNYVFVCEDFEGGSWTLVGGGFREPFTLEGSGTTSDLGCWYGYAGNQVRVRMEGAGQQSWVTPVPW